MIVVAGPPGSGKSTNFPLSEYGYDWFNADTRAAELNDGSFRNIPKNIREHVNLEFQAWILDHVRAGKSFALETTLRSEITFEQARLARAHGFWTLMEYVTAGSVEESIKRVTERSYRGGHSASERLIREIYDKSITNLIAALDFGTSCVDVVRIYDNSVFDKPLKPLLNLRRGRPISLSDEVSPWLKHLLKGSKFDISHMRQLLQSKTQQKGTSRNR
jgi:predicted ABC-type ATPase